ncbi:MAG: diphthamide synthesis protein [Candidatus Woesearchaeota archaeon]
MLYNLELNQVIADIKKEQAKLVCIQLPDGLKPQADKIEHEITSKTSAKVLIWLGSCFGACDIPLELKNLNVDLLFSWGHNRFVREEGW